MNLRKFIKQYNTEMSESDDLLFDSIFQTVILEYLRSHPDDKAVMHFYLNQAFISNLELADDYLADVFSQKFLDFLTTYKEYKIGLHQQMELFFKRAPELKEKVFLKKENENEI